MLILQRNEGESIYIGDQIKIHFLAMREGAIKVGIEAPKELIILRDELVDKRFKRRK